MYIENIKVVFSRRRRVDALRARSFNNVTVGKYCALVSGAREFCLGNNTLGTVLWYNSR